MVWLTALAAALVGSALPQAAGASAPGFSFTPSKTEPYAVCGHARPGHSACLAILVPSASALSSSRVPRPSSPAVVSPSLSGTGVGGGYAPADLRSAYNLPSETAGSGQTVAIVDAFDDPKAESDLAVYRSHYGLPACTTANGCFKKVNQKGEAKYPAAEAGWAVEISLDIDMVSAACPNCHILLVEATNNLNANLYAAEDEAATLGATEISNSYGGEEVSTETTSDSHFHHPGVSIFASAGDSGYEVEYPAASQYVIATGGTVLTPASNSRGWSETVWKGTGSGCSLYEPKPAWQTASPKCTKRTNNDIAAVAAPETPVSVADSYKLPQEFEIGEPGWTLVGGTSVSSPLMAGTMGLANAHTRSFGGADAYYVEASQNGTGVLDDVTSGTNTKEGKENCGNYLCNGEVGYDGPTGLGSPYGAPIVLEPPTVAKCTVSMITQTSATLCATVNPNGVLVTECYFEYGTKTPYEFVKPCSSLPGSGTSPVEVSAPVTGLVANTTYHFRVSATNPGGTSKGSDETFKTLPNPPTVVTKAASSVTQTSATMNATVNPNGGEVSECKLEYGTTTEYGKSEKCTPSPGTGESAVAVSASVAGLSAKTTYHFRISATNPGGTSKGSDETLKTLPIRPTVVTKGASALTQTTATLNATVNPNGGTVSDCHFEYGPTEAYGSSEKCTALPGSGESPVTVSAAVSGLTVNTTYHFRISATNAGGTSEGADETFKRCASTSEGFCTTFTHLESREVPFGEPNAVTVDPSGNIWVADSAHDHVLEFNSKREFLKQLGSEGSGSGQFKGIGGLASDASGDIYVTDTGNNRVEEFSSSGAFIRTFGSSAPGSGQLLSPGAVAIDSGGDVWVLNAISAQEGGRIVEFSSSGGFLSQFGSKGTGHGQLLYATGLAFSGGHLYVAEISPGRVQELSSSGEFIAQFDETGSLPDGIATDPTTGNLYVSELANRVQEFSPTGTHLATFGSYGAGNGQLSWPEGVAVNSSGNVYLADARNQRIEEWKGGEPPTFAASFTHLESREVQFGEPTAVAVGPGGNGNIWVADELHDHVLEFNSGREFVRQFGSEGSGEGQFKGIGGLASDASGDIYVTDTGNNRVEEFSSSGTLIRSFGSSAPGSGQLLSPGAVAIDESGDVWVLNGSSAQEGGRIVEFSSSGGFLSQFGSKGTGHGQLLYATGLAFSGGHLYVAEVNTGRVQELSSSGAFIAQFDETGSLPDGIATDPTTGDLYVSELANRVQEFSPTGSHLATFGSYGSGNGQLSSPHGVAVGSSGTIYVADSRNERLQEWAAGS